MKRFVSELPSKAKRLLHLVFDWDESQHKRDEKGQFTETGGSSGGSSSSESSSSGSGETNLEELFADLWGPNPDEKENNSGESNPIWELIKASEEGKKPGKKEPTEPRDRNGLGESEYPEHMKLSAEERKEADLIERYLDADDKTRYKDPELREVWPEEAQGMLGNLSKPMIEGRIKNCEERLAEAEKMIALRKSEGYKGKQRTGAEWRALQRELQGMTEHEKGDLLSAVSVGKNGIRHWQMQRNDMKKQLEHFNLAKKLQERYEYARKNTA